MRTTLVIAFIVAILLIVFISSKNEPYSGRVIAKEFVEEHWCCSYVERKCEAVILPSHTHTKIPNKWYVYVANKCDTRCFEISEQGFNLRFIGEKVWVSRGIVTRFISKGNANTDKCSID